MSDELPIGKGIDPVAAAQGATRADLYRLHLLTRTHQLYVEGALVALKSHDDARYEDYLKKIDDIGQQMDQLGHHFGRLVRGQADDS